MNKLRTSVLSAFPIEGGIRLSWGAERGTATPLRLYGGPGSVADGDLRGAQHLGSTLLSEDTCEWTYETCWTKDGSAEAFALVDAHGKVLATAVPARLPHPRLIDPGDIAKARRLIARPGTPRQSWQALLRSLDEGTVTAREAAFAYAVTGEQSYAQQAFALFRAAARIFRTQQMLEAGNAMFELAPAYDLAYGGWTEGQRIEARETLSRALTCLAAVRAPNLDDEADKASNWVAVIHGAELLTYLAISGEGVPSRQERRLPFLVDVMRRHLDDFYSPSGWSQEGWDYTEYALTAQRPVAEATRLAGIRALDAAWHRPRTAELAVRTHSLRPRGERLQFGVGERTGRLSPQLLGVGSPEAQSAYLWMYEQTTGAHGTGLAFTPPADIHVLLNWPEGVEPRNPGSLPALLDDFEGGYAFRNRIQNDDDLLLGVTSRNRAHLGWSQHESLALTLIGQGTTWAGMPAKENTTISLYSKPLIDGRAQPSDIAPGRSSTRASHAYEGQGGGFVSLDAAKDFGMAEAERELLVDLRPIGGADGVIALHDRFADYSARRIDWQLAPEPGVDITYGEIEGNARTFVFRRADAWLKGWLLEPSGAGMSVADGAFRVTRTGRRTGFRIVMAMGRGALPTARASGTSIVLNGVAYDTDKLAVFVPECPASPHGETRSTLFLSPPGGLFMPGGSRTVHGVYTDGSAGGSGVARITLDVPEGWTAVHTSSARTGGRLVNTWQVTAPGGAQPGDYRLTARVPDDSAPPLAAHAHAALVRTDLALDAPTEQSSTQGPAERAVDGNTDGIWGHSSVTSTLQESQPWWQTDLGRVTDIGEVVLWNRVDCCGERLTDFYVMISERPFDAVPLHDALAREDVWRHRNEGTAGRVTTIHAGVPGRYVRVQLADPAPSYLLLAEVQVYAPEARDLAEGRPAQQSSTAEDGAAAYALDGASDSGASVTREEIQPWWETDLGENAAIGTVEIRSSVPNRTRPGTDYYVLTSESPFASGKLSEVLTQPGVTAYHRTVTPIDAVPVGGAGRHVRIQLAGERSAVLSLTRVRVLR
ncbi:discoidin domain-containing protein [Streptomyces sp. NPDC050256]|uniref:galactose-binding domain-containing protein n=1 Tax=Streptomyces sp. NPDC050256 TaxID=3365607 RepID=UPI0037ABE1E3